MHNFKDEKNANRGEIKNDVPGAPTALHDEILQVGLYAAQLAGRGAAWVQQQNAVQGDDPEENRRDDLPARGEKIILKAVTTKSIYTSRMTDLLVPPKVELKFP